MVPRDLAFREWAEHSALGCELSLSLSLSLSLCVCVCVCVCFDFWFFETGFLCIALAVLELTL